MGLRGCVLGLTAIGAALFITSDAADARHHARHVRVHTTHVVRHAAASHGRHHHASAESGYSPPSASIVVDGNSGSILEQSNPDAPRHPASLTKIMTLYLLFERLDAGKIKLDSPLQVSAHASGQSPTKLGLKPGQSLPVEDAIKGIVTRSANDAAVTIAENLGGDEESFAKMMTQKAQALGMSRTTYVNASGLPADDQITTARDQALLGRAIQERFPRYYKYFSTPSFTYHGEAIRNHNHLLGSVQGVDGIKTGFTHASGFNLVTSLHRDGRYIVAVVLGGHSSFERDAHMRDLISTHIKEAALRRTTPVLAEVAVPQAEPQPIAFAKAPLAAHAETAPMMSRADPAPTATVTPTITPNVSAHVAAGSSDPIQPLLVKTVSYRIAPVQPSSMAPMPPLVASSPQMAAAKAALRTQMAAAPAVDAPRTVVASAEPSMAGMAAQAKPEIATKPEIAKPEVAKPEAAASPETAKPEMAKTEVAKVEPIKAEPAKLDPPRAELTRNEPATQIRAHGGWLIQIGAFDAEDEAKQHLSDARTKVHATLAAADPFTERVQKGEKALYRARFAGFDKDTAEAACKQLKRNDFECMALKN
jgi:D-alanyl-D-alanine carboxypeptidase